jgi:hypothetical protein
MRQLSFVVALLCVLGAGPAYAWGDMGHTPIFSGRAVTLVVAPIVRGIAAVSAGKILATK